MHTVDLRDPDAILAYLAQPIRAVRDSLDDGISYADSVLHGLPPDDHFWAHAVRYRACQCLRGLPGTNWRITRALPNSGIEVARDPLLFRTLKTQGDAPPSPGASCARRAYWQQRPQATQLAFPLEWNGIQAPIDGANLLLDWNVDQQRRLSPALSKPLGVWRYQGVPKLEWRRLVVFGDDDEPRFKPGDGDVDVAPRFDMTELEEGEAG